MQKKTHWRPIVSALAAAAFVAAPAAGHQEADTVEFGITSMHANDGECDDPRFEGPGMSSIPSPRLAFQDAADCRSAHAKGRIWLSDADPGDLDFGLDLLGHDGYCDDPGFEGPGMAGSLDPDNAGKDAFDCRRAYLVAKTIWLPLASRVFGDDSGLFSYDGECDDPRFENAPGSEEPGMADSPDRDSLGRDRSDCSSLLADGKVQWVRISIDEYFGDDSGLFSYDGECDDPRFENDPRFEESGMADSPDRDSVRKDAFDCARAENGGRIGRRVPASDDEVDFGDDSGAFFYDGECDDPRFENAPGSEEPGMAGSSSWDHVGKDAFDCALARREGRISLRDGWGTLHEAVIFGNLDEVRENLTALESADAAFPLLVLAAWTNEDAEIVELLVENGADPKRRAEQGRPAWAIAAYKDRSAEILEMLRPEGPERVYGGLAPLHILAAYTGDPRKLELFASSVQEKMGDGRTALHLAAEHNETEGVVSKLVGMGLEVDAADEDGETPLHRAIFGENAQAVEELLEMQADPAFAGGGNQMSPLELARDRGNRSIIRILRDHLSRRPR